MKLEEILKSPQIELHEVEDKNESMIRLPIINQNLHLRIVKLAEEIGIFDQFRLAEPNPNSSSLWFFHRLYKFTKRREDLELYESHVKKFEWTEHDEKYGSLLNHYLVLCEDTKSPVYIELVRTSIEEALSYVPIEEEIAREIYERRIHSITDKVMSNSSKDKIEEAKAKALEEPRQEEIEKTQQDLIKFRQSHAFSWAAKLCLDTGSQEDLHLVVRAYNNTLEWDNGYFGTEDDLRVLFQATRRDFIRHEYRKRVLEEAETEWKLGGSFDDLIELFFMTRLPEDRDLVDKIMYRGIKALKRGVSTNFSNFTHRLFDLHRATGDKRYLAEYESLTVTRNGKKKHPAYIGENPLVVLPVFEVTKDPRYISEIEAHCKSAIEKREYRSAEAIYFRMFELTGNRDYFVKAREMFEKIREEVSEEKPILSLENIFGAVDKVVSAQDEAQKILHGEPEDDEDYTRQSFLPSREKMNELEVAARLSGDVDILTRYALHNSSNPRDIGDLRRNISLLIEMQGGTMTYLNHLLNLYQITGASEDFEEIRRRFQIYVADEHNIVEHEDLLGQIAFKKY
ncbi:MAG: hypothetical protein Q8N99_00800 [Nanoarchaeota archaeon]|nr:hypothetical protein [Nanoarchaeota archaeon]